MKFIDLFVLSTRMFKAQTSRTLLTILGIGVGISAILFLVSFGYGLQRTLLERITTSDSLLTLDVTEAASESAPLDKAMVEKIKNSDGVAEVSPSFQVKAQGKIDELSADLSVSAVDSLFLRLGGIQAKKGKNLDDKEPNGIVVSSVIAQVFGKSDKDLIGKEMRFTFFVSDKNGASGNMQEAAKRIESDKVYKIMGIVESDENIIYIQASTLPDLGVDRFSQVKVKCDSNQVMPIVRGVLEGYGLSVSSLSDTIDQANKVFRVIQIVLMMFGVIALIVSAIGMFNTMTIALLERTEEIGIMKSIGASNMGISMIFLVESTIMGFLGGLVGIVIAFLEGYLFNGLINLIAERFGGEAVSLFYSPLWFVALIIVFSALVGFSTGIIPARQASNVDPLAALRYK